MFARQAVARLVAQPSSSGVAPQAARNMATLREIELRLKSVRNIEKITKVSKRVPKSSSRLVIDLRVLVHENDCLHETCKSPARHAEWEAVWHCQLGYGHFSTFISLLMDFSCRGFPEC